MLWARRISQLIFLAFFILLFLLARYPLGWAVPANFFLRLSPLNALASGLAGRAFVSGWSVALIVVVPTILLGRAFCGWVCPLGATLDIGHRLLVRNKGKRSPGRRRIKHVLLIFLLVMTVFSVNLAGWFDPLSILYRILTASLYPAFGFLFSTTLGALLNLDFFAAPLYRLNELVISYLLPPLQPVTRTAIFMALVLTALLFLEYFHPRFWCGKFCPLGSLLGWIGHWRIWGRRVSDACSECGDCVKTCKTEAIPVSTASARGYRTTRAGECTLCWTCQSVCPTEAISFGPTRTQRESTLDIDRRRLLWSAGAGIIGVGLLRSGLVDASVRGRVVRPPGARLERDFLGRCIRCGECIRVCSTTGRGLQPAILEAGLEGFWTPLLDARNGYCEYTCALCGQICPTGAIAPLPLEKKKVTRIGLAYFDRSRCIPWYRNEDCLVCEEHCPTPDKAIVFRLEEGILLDGQKRLVKRPYVREDLCIGCGICVTRCPVKGEPGVFLTNAQEQRGEKGKGPERETPAGGRVETSKSRRGGMRKGVSEGFLAS